MSRQIQFADWWEKPKRKRPGPRPGFKRHPQPAAIRTEKACAECKVVKPLTEYHKDARRADGRECWCKPCRNASRRVIGDKYLGARRGSQLPSSKLTEEDVRLIHSLANEREALREQLRNMSNAALAEKFEVSASTIDKIVNGSAWRHVV